MHPRPPFRLDLTVLALRRREQNAIDTWEGRTYRRALLVEGAPIELAVKQVGRAGAPRLEVVLAGRYVPRSADAAARSAPAKLLGLELDLSGFYTRAARDSLLNELAERYRGLKPPRFPSVFECLLNAVSCQQLSIAAGLTILSRLAATAGARVGNLHAFPAPIDVLGLPPSALSSFGYSERKADTIIQLARAAAGGKLELKTLEPLDDAAVVEALARQRGIGPWSADYVLLRGLGRLHVFPQSDVGALNRLRDFLARSGREESPRAALTRWVPDAGLVYFYLLLQGLEQRSSRSQRMLERAGHQSNDSLHGHEASRTGPGSGRRNQRGAHFAPRSLRRSRSTMRDRIERERDRGGMEKVTVITLGELGSRSLAAFNVTGNRIAVARVGDAFHAFDDTCTHEGCSLADGELEATTVTCPCHGSQFDVTTGDVLRGPAREPVRSYQVRLEDDALQVEV